MVGQFSGRHVHGRNHVPLRFANSAPCALPLVVCHSQDAENPGPVGAASALAHPLHPDLHQLDQPGRTLGRGTPETSTTRGASLLRRTGGRHLGHGPTKPIIRQYVYASRGRSKDKPTVLPGNYRYNSRSHPVTLLLNKQEGFSCRLPLWPHTTISRTRALFGRFLM